MSLAPGTRLGSYEIIGPVGAGGMGEVYRAKDTKLNRDVAIKVLPEAFANDAERVARFTREAQTLAALNHPNIAAIYGIESNAIVMELVEGQDLSARIARGRIPLNEALAIAKQIADALETAHEAGIIHRDLKPANVKVREDGAVKVLDFGLAKAFDPAGGSSADLANSPTLTAHATQMGVILGTAAYMSPEQAKGKTADRRADVWAFGVVLFEMITGQQLFQGDSAPEVMASVMKEDPNWSRLPADLPDPIRRLLRRCLEKDPKKRLSSMNDARLELGEPDGGHPSGSARTASRSMPQLGAAAAVGAVVTALVFMFVVPALRSAPERHVTRTSVLGPEGVTLAFDAAESAISPDGRAVVFTTVDQAGSLKLWVRPLDAVVAQPLAGTEGGRLPFWSPDSRQIGFFSATDGKLKKIPATGGTAEVLCEAKDGRGGSWSVGDVIVFAPSNGGPLQRVSANGGEPTVVTMLDAARGETGHRFPWFLPDGKHFLFATVPAKNQRFELFVGSLDGAAAKPLGAAESAAAYAEPGYLLFARQNTLMAQPFDVGALAVSGEPTSIGEAPSSTGGLYASGRAVSVSRNGTIEYLGDRQANTALKWFDRSGRPMGELAAPEGRYQEMVFSPDGRRAAITRYASQNSSDIWMADVARGGATRFTSAAGLNTEPVWSADGSQLIFATDRTGARDFWKKPSTGATPEEPFFTSGVLFKDVRDWSRDGKFLVFEQLDPKLNNDIWVMPTDGDRTPKPYLRTPFNELFGKLSPDGKWLAYVSDESGRSEVYVDSFPVPRGKYRVTDTGAFAAFWRNDGRELGIVSADARSFLVSDVAVSGTDIKASTPRAAIPLPKGAVWAAPTPDLQRVLVSVPVAENALSSVTVVFDWVGALKKK
ncbi:MAG: serine/threonine-protein kinase [Acidobacteria bacterium]|nr:MAG: serine/threonine-protein kinase [Acidobacteriota bacterium]